MSPVGSLRIGPPSGESGFVAAEVPCTRLSTATVRLYVIS
jgi:hypothetical protein